MVSQVTVILTRQDAVTSVCIVFFNQYCLLPVTVTAFLLLIFSTANIFVTRTCRMHTKRNMQVVSLFATELHICSKIEIGSGAICYLLTASFV